MTTVAVVSSCMGPTYWPFLSTWAHALAAVERQPDEIVVTTDAPKDVRARVESVLKVEWVTAHRTWQHHAAYVVNDAIEATTSEWIAKLDVDDRALPQYLTGLDDTTADVWCVGYRYVNHDVLIADWTAEAIVRAENNLLASCSPFRRWLWDSGEWPDCLFDDWVFWIQAAAHGATFASSHAVGYEYIQHPDQATKIKDHAAAFQAVQAAKRHARC